jgi:hypothetical protein
MKNLFFYLLTFFLGAAAYAQGSNKGFEDGFAVLAAGDTLKGGIKFRSGDEIKDRITLKISEEEKRTYKATELKSFTAGNETFISYKLNDEMVFLKELARGSIELYELQIPFTQGGSDTFKYEMYYRKQGETSLTLIKQGSWKKQVAELIADNSALAQQVEKGKVKLDDLASLIQNYNSQKE